MKKNMRFLCSAALLLSLVLLTGCSNPDNPMSPMLKIDQSDVTLNVGESFTRKANTLSFSPVYYTSSDESVAEVDPVTGEVTAVDGGVAVITAMVDGDDMYAEGSMSYQVVCYKGVEYAADGDQGRLVCQDGHIHKVDCDEACDAKRVAMVAYVGDESFCENGLAIALKDANDDAGKMTWADALEYVSTWNDNYFVPNAEWRLPSTDDLQYMAIGCGSETAYKENLSFDSSMDIDGLYANMLKAGVAPLDDLHWTSDGYDNSAAWEVKMTIKKYDADASVLLKFVFFGTNYDGDKTRYILAF